jgi:hypothetical protein
MSSRLKDRQHHAKRRQGVAATPPAGVQSVVRSEPAANDAVPHRPFAIVGDPLFGMAIASVILFAILAALVAIS